MASMRLPCPPRKLLRDDASWPLGLNDLRDVPAVLHVVGTLPVQPADVIAVVGTRFADADALTFTRRLASQLAAEGCTIISGGAYGVDAAAHEGALAVGGKTIAVLATGFERAYPPSNAGLFEEIAASGALVSERSGAPPGGQGWRAAFLRRNRLVAAMAEATVVVQAPARSGALSTATYAKRLKRHVFAVPSWPWDPRGSGCLQLLAGGGRICTSAADVLSLRPPKAGQLALQAVHSSPRKGRRSAREPNDDASLSHCSRALLRLLSQGPRHVDELCRELDVAVAELQEPLLALMLGGLVQRADDGTYERRVD